MQNADQALAEAWDNSAAAREELGEQPGMIRRAVGLGRSLLDPLAVLAALCGAPRAFMKLIRNLNQSHRNRNLMPMVVCPLLEISYQNCLISGLSSTENAARQGTIAGKNGA